MIGRTPVGHARSSDSDTSQIGVVHIALASDGLVQCESELHVWVRVANVALID